MSRENAIAIQYGMLGGTVDKMLKQVQDTTIECRSCREEFRVTDSNFYAVRIDDDETDDVIRWPIDDDGQEWKIFLVCDEQAHALRVDEWSDEIPSVVEKYP